MVWNGGHAVVATLARLVVLLATMVVVGWCLIAILVWAWPELAYLGVLMVFVPVAYAASSLLIFGMLVVGDVASYLFRNLARAARRD